MFFYVHGFNSGKNSFSVKNLRNYIPDIIPLEWKCEYTCKINISYLIDQVHENFCCHNTSCITMIGSSMGGYYARAVVDILSEKYDASCILFNPVVNPQEQIKQFIGTNTNYATGVTYEFTREALNSYKNTVIKNLSVPTIIFVSDCDELLKNNLTYVQKTYSQCSKIVITHTSHHIDNYEPYIDSIRSIHKKITHKD